jgi:hypothetical protein
MNFNAPRIRNYLQHFELEKLFIEELGWDRHTAALDVQVDGRCYSLRASGAYRSCNACRTLTVLSRTTTPGAGSNGRSLSPPMNIC